MPKSDEVFEFGPEGRSDPEALSFRLRQQSLLAEFGGEALRAKSRDELINEAVRLCAKGMRARLCKVLEYIPGEDEFRILAGVGWKPGHVGTTSSAGRQSPAGHAFHTGQPLVSNHLDSDTRFRPPQILLDHSVLSVVDVPVMTGQGCWGVLEAGSPHGGKFDEADVAFMQGIASLLGAAIDHDEAGAALRRSEQRFRVLANSLPHLAWISDETGSITWLNQRWYEFTGATEEQSIGWGWLNWVEFTVTKAEKFRRSLASGTPWEDICTIKERTGKLCHFLSRAEPIRDESGRIVSWVGTNTDITEQKTAEEVLRTLNREVSHRVKNSLSLVSSLLHLQASTANEEARIALNEAASRVYAVAAVHDQLWRHADASDVDLASFLTDLCTAISTTARHRALADVESIIVSADTAVSIGLLVNELVTNAIKYAYPHGESGDVRVSGTHEGAAYRLVVSDAGQGLPKGFDLATPHKTLGMRIVTALAHKLEAELSFEDERPGTRFMVLLSLKKTRLATGDQTS